MQVQIEECGMWVHDGFGKKRVFNRHENDYVWQMCWFVNNVGRNWVKSSSISAHVKIWLSVPKERMLVIISDQERYDIIDQQILVNMVIDSLLSLTQMISHGYDLHFINSTIFGMLLKKINCLPPTLRFHFRQSPSFSYAKLL